MRKILFAMLLLLVVGCAGIYSTSTEVQYVELNDSEIIVEASDESAEMLQDEMVIEKVDLCDGEQHLALSRVKRVFEFSDEEVTLRASNVNPAQKTFSIEINQDQYDDYVLGDSYEFDSGLIMEFCGTKTNSYGTEYDLLVGFSNDVTGDLSYSSSSPGIDGSIRSTLEDGEEKILFFEDAVIQLKIGEILDDGVISVVINDRVYEDLRVGDSLRIEGKQINVTEIKKFGFGRHQVKLVTQ